MPKNNPATIAARTNTNKEIIIYDLGLKKRMKETKWVINSTSKNMQSAIKRKNLIHPPDKSKSST
jgi:hypothetical protein